MPDVVFVDTNYWVAITVPGDQWRETALAASASLGSSELVTTQEVLAEYLNAVSKISPGIRQRATLLCRSLAASPTHRLVLQTPETFEAGLKLYEQRPDKGYSLTDCISMATMRSVQITRVLTSDHHFAQEGFEILIRRDLVLGQASNEG